MAAVVKVRGTLDDLDAKSYQQSLYRFVRDFWPYVESQDYIDNWHVKAICDHLQAVTTGRIKRLIINIPPGCSKSLLVCVFWPVWEWAIDPSVRWFFASYDQRLSTRDSVRCRALINSRPYKRLWGDRFQVIRGQDQKTYYETDRGGYRLATSVGGHGTGEHPDRIVVDDPHNVREAESEVERQAVLDWWDQTMTTRGVARDARRVIVMQRLKENDLSGHILSKDDSYVHVCLCMRHERGRMPTTPLGWNDPRTRDGELLAPEQFTEDRVKEIEKGLGAYGTAGQLQQRPRPKGGGMFQCLVAGTLIDTSTGRKPIEEVRAGEKVLTRAGYKEVEWSGQTGVVQELVTVLFSNGSTVTSTPEHLVLVQSRGFVRMDEVTGCDEVLLSASGVGAWKDWPSGCCGKQASTSVCAGAERSLSLRNITGNEASQSTARGITGDLLLPRSSCLTGYGTFGSGEESTTKVGTERSLCSKLCGGFIGGTFPLAITYTTRIGTRTTTRSRILSAFHPQITQRSTDSLTTRREKRHTSGTDRRRDARSTEKERCGSGACERCKSGCVRNVGAVLPPGVLERLESIAVERATKNNDGEIGTRVYDLTVRDQHEFFANGILVHNSHYFNQRVVAAPYDCKRIRFVDRASTLDGGCYTASVLMAQDKDGNYYVEDVLHGQWEPEERNQRLLACAIKDRMKYGPKYEPVIYIEAEGGSSGRDAWKGVARVLAGFPVFEQRVTGSKDVRAEPWASQLASKNVYLVDNGQSQGIGIATWDINGYVNEHLMFRPEPGKRLGKYKDQVDASTGAFNLFANARQAATVRVMSIGSQKRKTAKLMVCDTDTLRDLVIENQHCLVVSVFDPLQEAVVPQHGIALFQGHLSLSFADVQPSDYQANWTLPLEPYKKPPSEVCFNQDLGKKFWNFLLKRRDTPFDLLVFHDDNEKLGLSLAAGVCDVLRIPRNSAIFFPSAPDSTVEGRPVNQHVIDVVKHCRGLVMS